MGRRCLRVAVRQFAHVAALASRQYRAPSNRFQPLLKQQQTSTIRGPGQSATRLIWTSVGVLGRGQHFPRLRTVGGLILTVTLVASRTKVAGVQVIHTISEMQQAVAGLRRNGGRLALVPTMGALHAGHAALMHQARADGAAVVVSIYVNPTQFGPKEDFTKYPRTLAADCALCEQAGVAVVFAPTDVEMYPDGLAAVSTWVDEGQVARRLEGERRPGHFRGVCTVVAKLFNCVHPDLAVFGQKDYQQLKVIQRMVRDLRYPIELIPMPTVREADGLALSSRNRYLTPTERAHANIIWKSLNAAHELFRNGERDPARLQAGIQRTLATVPAIRLDYAEVADGATLEPVMEVQAGNVILIAAYLGQTRLIDNLLLA